MYPLCSMIEPTTISTQLYPPVELDNMTSKHLYCKNVNLTNDTEALRLLNPTFENRGGVRACMIAGEIAGGRTLECLN